jgi:hypothetical protein
VFLVATNYTPNRCNQFEKKIVTKKAESQLIREKEKRDSRIKETRNFILKHTSGSLMNNQKWYRVFELVEQNQSEFELKTLLSSDIKISNNILELENNSVLIDNSGNFIDFLELEKLTLKSTSELETQLKELNVDFTEQSDKIEINGYRI